MTAGRKLLLFDTGVLLHAVRGGEVWRRIERQFQFEQRPDPVVVSVVSVGEALSLAARNKWGDEKRDRLEALFRELVVLDLNRQPILRAYAELDAATRSRPIGDNDLWIAATARATGAHLVTTDTDFDSLHPSWLQRTWIDTRR